ncbi:hypothetical protein BH09SUM1_BH09SUM1_14370 [soil metagenome]
MGMCRGGSVRVVEIAGIYFGKSRRFRTRIPITAFTATSLLLVASAGSAASPLGDGIDLVPADASITMGINLRALTRAKDGYSLISAADIKKMLPSGAVSPPVENGLEAAIRLAYADTPPADVREIVFSVANVMNDNPDEYTIISGEGFDAKKLPKQLGFLRPPGQADAFPLMLSSTQHRGLFASAPRKETLTISNQQEWVGSPTKKSAATLTAAGSPLMIAAAPLAGRQPDLFLYAPNASLKLGLQALAPAMGGNGAMVQAAVSPLLKVDGVLFAYIPEKNPIAVLNGAYPNAVDAVVAEKYLGQILILLKAKTTGMEASVTTPEEREDLDNANAILNALAITSSGQVVTIRLEGKQEVDREKFKRAFLGFVQSILVHKPSAPAAARPKAISPPASAAPPAKAPAKPAQK